MCVSRRDTTYLLLYKGTKGEEGNYSYCFSSIHFLWSYDLLPSVTVKLIAVVEPFWSAGMIVGSFERLQNWFFSPNCQKICNWPLTEVLQNIQAPGNRGPFCPPKVLQRSSSIHILKLVYFLIETNFIDIKQSNSGVKTAYRRRKCKKEL